MGTKAYSSVNNKVTEQTKKAKPNQVLNNAGGYVFQVDDMNLVNRFLIMGTEGGNYYVSESKLTYEVSEKIKSIIEVKGKEVVELIVKVSEAGLAPKNDPALFLLALCSASENKDTRKYALSNLWRVARIPTHLYHFVTFMKNHRGFGRLADTALEKWFNNKKAEDLAYSLTKYASRDGWSARDLLRLAKPKPASEGHRVVYNYVTYTEEKRKAGKEYLIENESVRKNNTKVVDYLRNVDLVKSGKLSEKELVKFVKENRFPMEVIPTDKQTAKVYEAVLESAGMTWIIRNLGNLSKQGVLQEGAWDVIKFVTEKLTSEKELEKARIHPINVLAALKTYSAGRGFKGNNTWNVVQKVVSSLDEAFYKSFKFVEPTNKRYYIGLDCSGSMFSANVNGMPFLNAAEVGACFAMSILKKEPFSMIKGYNSTMQDIRVSDKSSLSEVLSVMKRVNWGLTNCSLPMQEALKNKTKVDVFVNITDNETYAGNIHPFQALKQYRKEMGIEAKMIVLATSVSDFTIADPSDKGMMDVAGFSSEVPQIISMFAKGEI